MTEGKDFEAEDAECTGSSVADADVEGRLLLCGDCAELERPGVGGTSSRVSVGESARSYLNIFFSTFTEISVIISRMDRSYSPREFAFQR